MKDEQQTTNTGSLALPFRLQKILVPTDFSACADQALAYALDLARRHGAEVHLLHVIGAIEGDAYSPLRHSPEAHVRQETPDKITYNLLQSTLDKYDAEGVHIELVKRHGSAVVALLLKYVQAEDIDLIVLGTHGRQGVKRFIMGSVAERVVRQAPCSVLTVREQEDPPTEAGASQIQRILVPIDFSEHSKPLLQVAQALALAYGAQLDLLHVIEIPLFAGIYAGLMTANDLVSEVNKHAPERLQHLWEQEGSAEVQAKVHVEEGHATAHIVDFAERLGVDLIVLASQGHSGMEHFLIGSVAERVVRVAPCPVLTLRRVDVDIECAQPQQEAV
ncbi:MAG TPA: universal stress protein [Rhodothermales bacterium]|nr:universal stress protein [Rhodothermales bacterium]